MKEGKKERRREGADTDKKENFGQRKEKEKVKGKRKS